jgi:hypothetical protein
MKPREIFINACGEIAKQLQEFGFKPTQKGQTLKRMSADKDMTFEIYFQASHRNYSASVEIMPHISIYSKRLKEWLFEITKNPNENGLAYANNIGYISPYKTYKSWNLAGLSYSKSIEEITEKLKTCALPIFELFEDKTKAVEFLKNNGTQFNKWTENSLWALPFMICFAEKAEAEKYFNDFIKNCTFGGRIKHFYKELENMQDIDLKYSEFYHANLVKLAFVSGLEIKLL